MVKRSDTIRASRARWWQIALIMIRLFAPDIEIEQIEGYSRTTIEWNGIARGSGICRR